MADQRDFRQIHLNKIPADLEKLLKDICTTERRKLRPAALMLLEAAVLAYKASGFTTLTDWYNHLKKGTKGNS